MKAPLWTSIVVLASLLVDGGCYRIVRETRMQRIQVLSQPPGALIRQIDHHGVKDLGPAPVVAEKHYTVEVKRFNHWLWLWPILFGACSGIGFGVAGANAEEPQAGLITGSLCTLAFVPTLIGDIVGAVRSGKEIPPAVEPVQFIAYLDGHQPQSAWTPVPGPARVVEVALSHAATPAMPAYRPPPPSPTAPAPPRPKSPRAVIVAVFDVTDAAGRLAEKDLVQLTEFLAAVVTEVAGYRVVPRKTLRDRLRDIKKEGMSRCHDEACQIELGKAVAAQKSLATRLLQVGGTCAVSATLYDLKTETTEKATSVRTDCSVDRLMDSLEKVARQLAR